MAIKFKLALALAFTAGASPAFAEPTWVPAGRSDRTEVYVDTSSVKRIGNIVQYWVRMVALDKVDDFDRALILYEANCADDRYRSRQATVYYVNKGNRMVTDPEPWVFVTPGTVDEGHFRFACAR